MMCNHPWGACPNNYNCIMCAWRIPQVYYYCAPPGPINVIVGYCPRCGAPIYEDRADSLKVVHTCDCRKEATR